MKHFKRKLVKVDSDSKYNTKWTFDHYINAKNFVLLNIMNYNVSDVIRIDTPNRTQCFIITR